MNTKGGSEVPGAEPPPESQLDAEKAHDLAVDKPGVGQGGFDEYGFEREFDLNVIDDDGVDEMDLDVDESLGVMAEMDDEWEVVPGDELPAIWAAVDAVDAHIIELEEESRDWPVSGRIENVAGAMEEVRDHLAAAFDVVRQLAANLVPFAEQLEVLASTANDVDERINLVAEVVDGRFARVEQGMGELADWIEGRFETLGEAIGNDLDDLGDEVSGLAGLRAERPDCESPPPARATVRAEPASPSGVEETLVRMADRFEEVAEVLIERQDRLETELGRLTDEVTGYRRRVQVHARPPVITDDQLQRVVTGIIAGLGQPPPADRQAKRQAAKPQSAKPQSAKPQSAKPQSAKPQSATPSREPETRETETESAAEPQVAFDPEVDPEEIGWADLGTPDDANPEAQAEQPSPDNLAPPETPQPKRRGRRRKG